MNTGGPPGGNVTLVFTDIEGSTRLLQSLGDRWQHVLADHRTIMRDAWTRWNGYEMGTEGDSFFVSFPDASDAVAAAVQAQRALAAHTWADGARVRVRIGMHTLPATAGKSSCRRPLAISWRTLFPVA